MTGTGQTGLAVGQVSRRLGRGYYPCCGCGETKPETAFSRNRTGLQSVCKGCQRKKATRWERENPSKALVISARGRAKRAGMPCTITAQDIPIPDRCPVLGIEVKQARGQKNASSPTVDRVDNTRGYIHGNVAVISHRANTLKGNGTAAEHRKIADWMDRIIGLQSV